MDLRNEPSYVFPIIMQQVVQVSERTVLEQKAYMLFYVRDRRNTAPRKPIDILQRDNLKANVNGKSIFNQNPKERVQTGPVENKLCASGTSAAMTQKDTVNGGLSKETIMKKVPSQQNYVQLMAEGSVLKESILPSSNVPILKDSSQASASDLVHGENLKPSACSVVGSSNIENSTVTTGAKDSDCNERENSKRDFGVPVTISPNCGGLQNSGTQKVKMHVLFPTQASVSFSLNGWHLHLFLISKSVCLQINFASNIEVSSTVALEDFIDKAVNKVPGEAPSMSATSETSKNVQAIRSRDKPNCDSSQVIVHIIFHI